MKWNSHFRMNRRIYYVFRFSLRSFVCEDTRPPAFHGKLIPISFNLFNVKYCLWICRVLGVFADDHVNEMIMRFNECKFNGKLMQFRYAELRCLSNPIRGQWNFYTFDFHFVVHTINYNKYSNICLLAIEPDFMSKLYKHMNELSQLMTSAHSDRCRCRRLASELRLENICKSMC